MKEHNFSIASHNPRATITGGLLWQAPSRGQDAEKSVSLNNKTLCIAIRSGDTIEGIIKQLHQQIKHSSTQLYLRLVRNYLLEPLLLVLPAVLMIVLIGILGAYGNLVNELISLGEGTTRIGLSKFQLFYLETALFIIGAYAFPLVFQGDFSKTFSDAKKYLDTNERNKSRTLRALQFLSYQGEYVDKIEVWNPGILKEGQEWVEKILIPGILAAQLPVEIHAHMDEKFALRKLLERLTEHRIEWQETVLAETAEVRPIAMEYLEKWETELLPVMICASTANVPNDWYVDAGQQQQPDDTVLTNILSLPLMELLVERFEAQFFSNQTTREKVSVEVFFNRCLNDYGLLAPVNKLAHHMCMISPAIVQQNRLIVRTEMGYVRAWLQMNVEPVQQQAPDPAAALILAGTHLSSSIYDNKKLRAIEGFIQAITYSEQYKLLRKYWELMTVANTVAGKETLEIKLFRLIRTDSLKDLVQAFRRAGMYAKTEICYDYLRAIYPIDSGIGEGIVLGEQGKYQAAVEQLLKIEREWLGGELSTAAATKPAGLVADPVTQLNLHISLTVIVVMNRIAQYKHTAKQSLEIMDRVLSLMGDGERDNYQLARYYNVLASYYEWEGAFEQALNIYDKGLKIPEVDESLISSLLVNVGIIYRMVGKSKLDLNESIHYLKKGVEYNGEGVYAKEVIGNEDQLPIALHNLAETYIELAYRLQPGDEKNHALQLAYRHSQLGLDINKRIHSTKKLGQLLCERFLSVYWLEKLGVTMVDNQAEVQQQFLDWIKQKTAARGYDVEVVLDLMLRTDDFSGTCMEELGEWLNLNIANHA